MRLSVLESNVYFRQSQDLMSSSPVRTYFPDKTTIKPRCSHKHMSWLVKLIRPTMFMFSLRYTGFTSRPILVSAQPKFDKLAKSELVQLCPWKNRCWLRTWCSYTWQSGCVLFEWNKITILYLKFINIFLKVKSKFLFRFHHWWRRLVDVVLDVKVLLESPSDKLTKQDLTLPVTVKKGKLKIDPPMVQIFQGGFFRLNFVTFLGCLTWREWSKT